MEAQSQNGVPSDRRWYPDGDPVEWIRTTRETVFASVKRCIAHAFGVNIRVDARPDQLLESAPLFRELHICVDAYARGLYVLGQTEDGTLGLIRAAALEAAEPEELHPAVLLAIEQWCREARGPT